MSGTGPESLPTSADPRSKRPEIRIPAGAPDAKRRLPPPPEIVTNVQGSSAGAGSGEFHVYKAARRREYERLRVMDEEVRQEKEAEEFARKRGEMERRDDDKTRKNREKREKLKARKEKAKQGGKGAGGQKGDKQGGGDGGVKPRVDKADEAAKDARDGEVKSDSVGTDSKGDVPVAAAAAASTPGLVIHDDD
ncbi:hypothetical protein VP1G_06041 [Cytospora mali]|uniref:PRKR-interacting protein 1 n=1 Tax=Cytospora mali TaxID=578113 RepID=A0A194V470_CYTMA|nr:hypothetical protein VP1G_06041 [Valsa mali var. pyri (nom. inval.)]